MHVEPRDVATDLKKCLRGGCPYALSGIHKEFCCEKCSLQGPGEPHDHGRRYERIIFTGELAKLVPRASSAHAEGSHASGAHTITTNVNANISVPVYNDRFGTPSGKTIVLLDNVAAERKTVLQGKLRELKPRKEEEKELKSKKIPHPPLHTLQPCIRPYDASMYVMPRSTPQMKELRKRALELHREARKPRFPRRDTVVIIDSDDDIGSPADFARMFRDYSFSRSRSPLRRRQSDVWEQDEQEGHDPDLPGNSIVKYYN